MVTFLKNLINTYFCNLESKLLLLGVGAFGFGLSRSNFELIRLEKKLFKLN